MDLAIILTAVGLVLTFMGLLVAILVFVLQMSGKVGEVCGRYNNHLEACDKRFQRAERRLDKANL